MWFCTQWGTYTPSGKWMDLEITVLSERSQPHKASIPWLLLDVPSGLGMT